MEGATYVMLSTKFPNKGWLRGITIQDFTNHVDWLLGDTVYGMEIDGMNGKQKIDVPWHVLLNYDLGEKESLWTHPQ